MSSPTVSTVQPSSVGISIARLVFPHADGKAPVTYLVSPSGDVSLRISMCSARQPSSRSITEAMPSANPFLPSRSLPPYPDPYDQISRVSGKCTIHLLCSSHGHGTSSAPSVSGAPTECRHGTKSPPSPSTSSAAWPMRVMMRIETATYGESVSCTPMYEIGEPSGPIENGTTYIVRPAIEPSKSPLSFERMSAGSVQLLVGPASSSRSEQM